MYAIKKGSGGEFPIPLTRVVRERLRPYSLTPREQFVVSFLLQGYANKEIAERCHISEQTVKDHLKHVYEKVGIHQRAGLLARLLGTARP